MQSEKISINNRDYSFNKVLTMTDAFTEEIGYTGRNALRVRLLVEETLGMLRAMVGEYKAKLPNCRC